ncbi:MAG: pyridoxal-phosphate dependent enzyme [Bacteroidales bacterium]|nr:pyridoxal-phosphate dependent enzyme [Bacteroidales bacterium]MCF8396912.1 pyridoxal-phosphate dependent enzyme [Bacteroidales bacterium]
MNTLIDFDIPSRLDIVEAAERIRPYIHHTPVLQCEQFNDLFQANILFKCENFQKAGAFKSRGAVNAVFSLTQDEIDRGVCTHSSGNHAQAMARAAALRKCKAYIVMPETSPKVKVNAVKHYGGMITFCKPTLEARERTLQEIRQKTGAIEIHPYNNLKIITAQASAARELFLEYNDLDMILTPVGGGGLLSGTALAAKYFSSHTKVIACEPAGADDAYRSFHDQKFYPSLNPKTIADGLLTSLGSYTFPLILEYVDTIVKVQEDSIIHAMKLIWERMKIIVEPSAAVTLAAILEKQIDTKGMKIALILSGGNVDLNKLPWS